MRRSSSVGLVSCFCLGGCLLFTERPHEDASAVHGPDASASSPPVSTEPAVDAGPPAVGSPDDLVCEMSLTPENDCRGPGGLQKGDPEAEPNPSTSPEVVFTGDNTTVVCGEVSAADPDFFTFDVDRHDCWEVDIVSDPGVTFHVHGPGVDKPGANGSVIQFTTGSESGKVAIDVSGDGNYRFAIR